MSACDADDLAAYLLGALTDAESDALERHLVGCDACRAELRRLRHAVDALPRAVERVAPPPSLKRAVMRAARAKRAPRGRRLLAPPLRSPLLVATALALFVGIALGFALTAATAGRGRTIAARVNQALAPGAHATLVVPAGGSTAVLHVSGLPDPGPGRIYELWLKRRHGIVAMSLFGVPPGGLAAVAAPLRGVTAVLVTEEPSSGAVRPTSPTLIEASLRSSN